MFREFYGCRRANPGRLRARETPHPRNFRGLYEPGPAGTRTHARRSPRKCGRWARARTRARTRLDVGGLCRCCPSTKARVARARCVLAAPPSRLPPLHLVRELRLLWLLVALPATFAAVARPRALRRVPSHLLVWKFVASPGILASVGLASTPSPTAALAPDEAPRGLSGLLGILRLCFPWPLRPCRWKEGFGKARMMLRVTLAGN